MKRQSISLTLTISFGFLLCVLLGLGWLGLSRMGRINADLEDLVTKRWAKVQFCRAALSYSNSNNRITMEIFLLDNSDRIPSLLKSRAENTLEISALVRQIEELGVESGKERELLDAIVATRTPYIASYLQALHLLTDDHKYTQARAAIVEQTLPLLIQYHNAWNHFMEFQGEQIDEAAAESRSRYGGAHRMVLSLLILATGLCAAVGFHVTRRMTKEIRLREKAEEQVGCMNAALEQKVIERTQELAVAKEALFVEKERAQVTLNSIGDAVACTDISGNITFLNLVAEKMTGWSGKDAAGRPVADVLEILDATSRKANSSSTGLALDENRTVHSPSNNILVRQDGLEIPIEDSVAPIHDREGQATGAVIVFRDVSAARAMALELAHSAEHDSLTGLPNRALLTDRVNQAIILASRYTKKVGVLFLDLDGFKHINDSLGHPAGDKLLQSVAKRLRDCVRASDTVSRQGGDEFVVLLSEMEHFEDAAVTARRLLRVIEDAHFINQQDLHVTTSIGISVYPDDGLDAETLIKNADTAMYQAKENERQSYQFFKSSMNERAVERQSIEEGLRRALERREFTLYYQPKVNLKTGKITGAEALLRWNPAGRGLVSPAKFIPIAEDCGLIIPIGKWVLREACTQARAWLDAGLASIAVAVNISAKEFRHERFLEGVFEILNETGLDPKLLELELTEGVLMKRVEATGSILATLRAKGVRVAVDDFGTGYSSLSYLRKFPIDALKIDQSFVRQITTSPGETSIVTAIISMGRSLGLLVVAEGVETREERAFLQAQECEEAQGYYFSRPLPPGQFVELLKSGKPESTAA
jgi:diguanylate cyclase (GGDEF)-like protein/PAS domain S-box-containing protein